MNTTQIETTQAPKYEVRVAETASDRQACFRLRYDVYVAELGRNAEIADHANRELSDSEDAEAIVVGVFRDGVAVATARINLADAASGFVRKYGLQGGLTPTDRVAIVSRLMISPSLRGTGVFKLLITNLFQIGARVGVSHAFIECREHLVSLYQHLGFELQPKVEGPFSLMTLRVKELTAGRQVA